MPALYLYAFVDTKPRAKLGRGIHDRALSALAIAKKSAWVIVEPGEALAAEPETIVAHDRVIQRVAAMTPAILPLRFASVAPDKAAIEEMVRPLSPYFERAFERVRDAVQFTLRVAGPRLENKAKKKKTKTSAKLARPGTRYLEALLEAHRPPSEIDVVTRATKRFVREVRAERRGAEAAVYHLVARADVARYERALENATRKLDPMISMRSSGPWPPYAFAELAS